MNAGFAPRNARGVGGRRSELTLPDIRSAPSFLARGISDHQTCVRSGGDRLESPSTLHPQ
jgi:hypothetical protein